MPDGTVVTTSSGAKWSFNVSENYLGGMGLDTGSETASTEYYIYVIKIGMRTAGIIVSTVKPINGGPVGYKYWNCIGAFYNNSSSAITSIIKGGNNTSTISDFVEYALTIGATTTAPTKATTIIFDKAYWRRNGDTMEIVYTYKHTSNTGAANGSGTYLFPIPAGYTIDTSKIAFDTGYATGTVGSALIYDTASNVTSAMKIYNSTNMLMSSNSTILVGSSNFQITNSTIVYSFTAKVPITGWSATEF
jgi:hypothetical protein